MALEIEVKFYVGDLSAVRGRLVSAENCTLKRPRIFERNMRYDTPDNALMQRAALIRLRQDSRVTMTYKGMPPIDQASSEARVREELEIEVSDFDTAEQMLLRLGFVPRQAYEKYRETWQFGTVEVVLDEMPYGDFVELEGDENAIKAAAQQLGLNWEHRIIISYLGLLDQLNTKYGTAIPNLTFGAFEGVAVSAESLLPDSLH